VRSIVPAVAGAGALGAVAPTGAAAGATAGATAAEKSKEAAEHAANGIKGLFQSGSKP